MRNEPERVVGSDHPHACFPEASRGTVLVGLEYGVHGVWHRTLDAQGRLRVPTQAHGELADGAVLSLPARMTDCIEIWPTENFVQYVAQTLDQLRLEPRGNMRAVELAKFFRGCSLDVDLDRFGRLVVPAVFC